MNTFETGKTYGARSICDHDCIHRVLVLSRTPKTITADVNGRRKTLHVRNLDGVEQVKPLGSYSMAPIVRADDRALALGVQS